MSIVFDILENLMKLEFRYKGARLPWIDTPRFNKYSPNSVKVSFSRLHKKGFISRSDGNWIITTLGENYLKKHKDSLKIFDYKIDKKQPKNLIVMFDIPENQKKERAWFREHLQKLGYTMIQKSVWVGPSPLPREFTAYVKKIGLKESIKTFKLSKAYTK